MARFFIPDIVEVTAHGANTKSEHAGQPYLAAYVASKAGLAGLIRASTTKVSTPRVLCLQRLHRPLMDAHDAGDRALATDLRDRGERLKRQFNEQFQLPERVYYAIALDRDKRPVDACASNMGHCLWSGIVDEDKARQVAERITSPEMFSG